MTRAWRRDGRRGGCRPLWLKALVEIAFEDNHGRSGVHAAFVERTEAAVLKQARTRFDGAETLVVKLHGDAKAAMDFIGELTRPGGIFGVLKFPI